MKSVFSAWERPSARPPLDRDQTVDVAVIGAGMAGVLIARQLTACGATVAVLEARRIGSGQTAGTTAKLTAQHGMRYSALIQQRGITAARLYATAHMRAIAAWRQLVLDRNIDCDFTEADAYLYSLTDRQSMEQEAAAQCRAGLPARFTTDTALPLPVAGAVQCTGGAHFHPQKLLYALAASLPIYEHTPVRRIEGNTLLCDKGRVHAAQVVFACHYPFVNWPGLYFMRMHQERSYVLALRDLQPPQDMYWSPDTGGVSLRPFGKSLLLGGGGHRTGEKSHHAYETLRHTASAWFPHAQEEARWSAQDCMTPDDLPYIGRFSLLRPTWFVATGFGKWGMTTAMVAAHLLAEELGGRSMPESRLFSPARFGLREIGGILKESGHAVRGLTRLWLTLPPNALTLAPDEGKIVTYQGRRVGVYRAPDGTFYAVSPRCPHLGCTLSWNADERTWDCPCHGSRFAPDGHRLNGPAETDLEKKSTP